MKSKRKKPLFLIIIDGQMGSGKTTVASILHKKLKRTAYLGLDRIKWQISDFKRVPADNEIVRNVVGVMAKEYLRQGISVIIEQGMREKQIKALQRMVKQYNARCFTYQLEAPKSLLLQRISRRVKVAGKPKISKARIERNWRAHLKYKYPNAVIMDSEKLSAQKIASLILKAVNT